MGELMAVSYGHKSLRTLMKRSSLWELPGVNFFEDFFSVMSFNAFKFILMFHSIFTFFLLGEIRNLTTLSLLPLVKNCFSLSSFFQSLGSFLWIGAQFPQVKFLSYGRILTLHYYFLLMCILFSWVSI